MRPWDYLRFPTAIDIFSKISQKKKIEGHNEAEKVASQNDHFNLL